MRTSTNAVGLDAEVYDGSAPVRSAAAQQVHLNGPAPHMHSTTRAPKTTLEDLGLAQRPMSANMSLNRHGQPLCGTVLDDQFLLIGTTSGLDFLPLCSHHLHIKKPLPLIKRTRFKQLAVLTDRSNVLLAIAGRNDHVRGKSSYTSAFGMSVC